MGFLSRTRAHAVARPPRPSRRWLRRRATSRGQTLVEVGLVLPIFILTLVAVLEFGYYAAVSSAVQTASREGARYGSTVDDSGGTTHYLDCGGIRDRARDLSEPLVTLANGDITVGYDTGGTPAIDLACSGSVTASQIDRFDRIVVEVSYTYSPITPIMGIFIGDATLSSVDRRSIVK
jgi:TadE-like protein